MPTVKLPWPEPDIRNTVSTWSDGSAVSPPGDDFRAMAQNMWDQLVRDGVIAPSQVPASVSTYTPSPAAWPQSITGTWVEPPEPEWWPLVNDTSDWWSSQEWPGQRVLVIVARYDDEVLAHVDVARAREQATHDPGLAAAVVVYLPPAGQPIPPGAKAAIISAVESGVPVTFRRLAGR